MVFRDDWDRKAHDVMCIAKYGAPGGSVNAKDLARAGDLLRGGPFRPPVVAIPLPSRVVTIPLPVVMIPLPPKVL